MSRDHFSISFDRGVFRIRALEVQGGEMGPRQLDFKPHLASAEGCGARVGPW